MSRNVLAVLLASVAAVCAALAFLPLVVLRPFSPQTPRGLAAAWTARAWAPSMCLAGLAVGTVAAALLWGRLRTWWGRGAAVLSILLLAAAAWLAAQNPFEWMFHPVGAPRFVEASLAAHVEPHDMILGVRIGPEARAYPVRALAYHHIVNDVVAGEPIVATY